MINFNYSLASIVWMFIIVKLNILLVISDIVQFKKSDARNWIEHGENANFAKFNNLFSIIIDEENLREDKYCSGECDSLDNHGKTSASNLTYPNQCPGLIFRCWFYEKSEKRKEAESEYKRINHIDTLRMLGSFGTSNSQDNVKNARYIADHTGNICKCLCNRLYDPNPIDERGTLLNYICSDPVSVDEQHVTTGVRFKRYDNVIYLELQQAKLNNGRITSKPKWKVSRNCQNKNVIYEPDLTKQYKFFAEDIILTEDAVVTGVTFGQSLSGRYINSNGNINLKKEEFTKSSNCTTSCSNAPEFLQRFNEYLCFNNFDPSDIKPYLPTIPENNYERSESCKTKIFFRATSPSFDDMQHVVPYVDLQEIVTDPPAAIHGIGWYLRSYPGYGGFLALKIFIKE